jgi:hypothetical protein
MAWTTGVMEFNSRHTQETFFLYSKGSSQKFDLSKTFNDTPISYGVNLGFRHGVGQVKWNCKMEVLVCITELHLLFPEESVTIACYNSVGQLCGKRGASG